MRSTRWILTAVALAALFTGGFFAAAAYVDERPVLDTIRSPGPNGGPKSDE